MRKPLKSCDNKSPAGKSQLSQVFFFKSHEIEFFLQMYMWTNNSWI